jgi:ABC-2 type transport system ATP-binding protein
MKTRVIQDDPGQVNHPAPVIEVRDLSKDFGRVRAVDHLSFAVQAGCIAGFLGPNGSGKTTTLRALVGLVRPSSGSALVTGRPYRDLVDPLHQVGVMLEATAHPGRRARDHLCMIAAEAGSSRTRVDELLELVNLGSAGNRRVGGFSLGMRQRLELAGALVGDPQILVLDEPANGLDPEGIRWLRDFLRGLAAEGRTILLSSHVLSEVAQTVDEVIVIHQGRLVVHEGLADLVARQGEQHVRVRPARPDELAAALTATGAIVTEDTAGTLSVTGSNQQSIAQLAFDLGMPVFEIATESTGLEETFFNLTASPERG